MTWFQTASGDWHWPSIWMALAWFVVPAVTVAVSGAFVVLNLRTNRADRVRAAEAAAISALKLEQAESDLSKTRRNLVSIRDHWAPRVISKEQQEHFVWVISRAPKMQKIVILSAMEHECIAYAQSLHKVMTESGYILPAPSTGAGVPPGLNIGYSSTTLRSESYVKLSQELMRLFEALREYESTSAPEGGIQILVGPKHGPAIIP